MVSFNRIAVSLLLSSILSFSAQAVLPDFGSDGEADETGLLLRHSTKLQANIQSKLDEKKAAGVQHLGLERALSDAKNFANKSYIDLQDYMNFLDQNDKLLTREGIDISCIPESVVLEVCHPKYSVFTMPLVQGNSFDRYAKNIKGQLKAIRTSLKSKRSQNLIADRLYAEVKSVIENGAQYKVLHAFIKKSGVELHNLGVVDPRQQGFSELRD